MQLHGCSQDIGDSTQSLKSWQSATPVFQIMMNTRTNTGPVSGDGTYIQSGERAASSTRADSCAHANPSTGSLGVTRPDCLSSVSRRKPSVQTRTGPNRTAVGRPVEFVQANLQHSKGGSAVMQKTLEESDSPWVGLICEPWVCRRRVCGLNNPQRALFAVFENDICPRAAVSVSKSLQPVFLPQLSTRDLVVVQVTIPIIGVGVTKLLVASAYLPGERRVNAQSLERVADFGRAHALDVIIAMDANAHHTAWGSTNINSRGEELLDFVVSQNLQILNRGNEPTFVSSCGREEVLDITLISPGLSELITDWEVSDDVSLSDHRHIRFRLKSKRLERQFLRNPRSTDWSLFSETLDQTTPYIPQCLNSIEEIDNAVLKVERYVMNAYFKACPRKPIGRRKQPLWWNQHTFETLRLNRKNARIAFKLALSSKDDADWDAYRLVQRSYKRVIRQAKRTSWQNFCQEIDDLPAMSRITKILRKGPSPELGMLKLPSGSFTTSFDEVLDHMLETHFPGCKKDTQTHYEPRVPSTACWREVNRTVCGERVRWAIFELDPYKSPGLDGIFPILLQKSIDWIIFFLIRIYRSSLAFGYVPKRWQTVRAVFIPKVGKTDFTSSKSYRPICLSSFLLKVMEKVVDRRLKDAYLNTHPLSVRQHAYQSGRSTETALQDVVSRVEIALEQKPVKQFVLACFLDLSAAFDNAQFCDIRNALISRGVVPVLIDWTTAMLSQRIIRVKASESQCEALAGQGTAQGGVLSAIFFVLIIDELLCLLNKKQFYTVGYSDDTTIVLKGIDLGTLCDRMNIALRLVEQWCLKCKMKINAGKTELMVFTRKRTGWNPRTVRLCGTVLNFATQVKYLGVTLDPKLNFSTHIELKCKAAAHAFHLCRGILGKMYGVSPRTALWLYIAIIRPLICHGCLFWWHAALRPGNKLKLSKIQRCGLLSVTGAMCTTPTAGLEVFTGILPFDLHIQQLAMLTAYRLSWTGVVSCNWTHALTGYLQIWNNLARVDILGMDSDGMLPKFVFNRNFCTRIPTREQWDKGEVTISNDTTTCYTDGSRCQTDIDGPLAGRFNTGAGVFSEGASIEESLSLGPNTTVFQAEMFAIKRCTERLLTSPTAVGDVTIYSDSQASIMALLKPKINSKLVLETKECLNMLSRGRKVQLCWITGHSGISGNDSADAAARAGANSYHVGDELQVGIAPATGKLSIKSWAKSAHRARWKADTFHRQTHETVPKLPTLSQTKWFLKLSRWNCRLLVALLTGHNTLNRHLSLLGLSDLAMCTRCHSSDETSYHFLGECVAYSKQREKIFGQQYLTITEISGFKWSKILKFIQISDRFE